jgi:hypothetical protein
MRQRKKDMDAIVRLLESEHDDVDELASEVWKSVDDARRDRELWVVAVRHLGLNFLYGPYESEATAKKDVERGSIQAIDKDDRYMILKLLSPSKIFEDVGQGTLFDIR